MTERVFDLVVLVVLGGRTAPHTIKVRMALHSQCPQRSVVTRRLGFPER